MKLMDKQRFAPQRVNLKCKEDNIEEMANTWRQSKFGITPQSEFSHCQAPTWEFPKMLFKVINGDYAESKSVILLSLNN